MIAHIANSPASFVVVLVFAVVAVVVVAVVEGRER